jgi:vitamin-K-epoxide reductase (warfarin-sensitive)
MKARSRIASIAASAFTLLGIGISLYAIYVEHEASLEEGYRAMCDISEEVSCSKVLSSDYSKLFSYLGIVPKHSILDQSNAFYGLVYFLIEGLLFWWQSSHSCGVLLLLMSAFAMSLCAYLSYLLAEVLHTICLVCYVIYAINTLIFILFACLFG